MIGSRLKDARTKAGLTQIDLAVAMGDRYTSSMVSQVESGSRSLRLDGAAKAASELDISLDYLVGLTDDPTPYRDLARRWAQLDAVAHEIREEPGPIWGAQDDLDDTRYVEIHEVEAAAGSGMLIEGAQVKGRLAFQRDWLRRNRINPEQCTVIGVSGDSMEPTLPNGCSILVDHSRRTRRRGRIYVLQDDDSLLVKRAGREKSGWLMLSDNPYWPPAPWPESATVIGEVRWSARTF